MQDWRPVLNDGLAAYMYHLLLVRMNENPFSKALGFNYQPEFTYEPKDELAYLDALVYKLEKKALNDYYSGEQHSLLVQRWITHNRRPPSNEDQSQARE